MTHPQSRSRGRPREPRAEQRIIGATLALLRERGPSAVSIAAVSSRSGVARTTIYRRFDDRRALLGAALQTVTTRGAPPEHLNVAEKVQWVLRRSAEVLDDGIGPGGLAAVLTGTDPEFSIALRAALEAGLQPLRAEIEQDIERGALSAELDPELTLSILLGTYIAELLRSGAPTGPRLQRIASHLSRILAT